eukprot:m.221034 g.221034  ORF g.221034 m.221034 type:complete len:231 (-) comp26310_c0_seq2:30-722(-)
MAKIKQESLRSRVAEQRWRRLMEDQEKKKQQDRIRRVPPPAEDDGLEEFDDEDNEFAPIDKSLQRTLKKEAEQRNKQPVIPTFQLGNPSTRKSNKIKSERHNPDSIRVRRVTAMLSQKIQQVLLSGRAGAIFMENSVELDEVVVNASLRHVVVRWHSQGKEQDRKLTAAFNQQRKQIRYLVTQAVRMKYSPDLRFECSTKRQQERALDAAFERARQDWDESLARSQKSFG